MKRALAVGAAATLIWVAVAEQPAGQAGASRRLVAGEDDRIAGLAATYPRCWHERIAVVPPLWRSPLSRCRGLADRRAEAVPEGRRLHLALELWSGLGSAASRAGTRSFELRDDVSRLLQCNFMRRGVRGPELFFVGGRPPSGRCRARSRRTGKSDAMELLDRFIERRPRLAADDLAARSRAGTLYLCGELVA